MRYLFGFLCVCALGAMPLVVCAETAGGVAYEGVCDCLVHAECDRPAEYCYKTEGCLLGGLCTEKPTFCGILPLPAPVCGCDSFTYESFCIAAMSGVSVKHEGRCIDLCTDNDDCFTPAEYCASDEGCDSNGACAPRPTICGIPPVPSHVCGCDGSTYESACFAAMAGVRVASDGLCP